MHAAGNDHRVLFGLASAPPLTVWIGTSGATELTSLGPSHPGTPGGLPLSLAALPSGTYAALMIDPDNALRVTTFDQGGRSTGSVPALDDVTASHEDGRIAASPLGYLTSYRRIGSPDPLAPAENLFRWVDFRGDGLAPPERLDPRRRVLDLRVLPDGAAALLYRVDDATRRPRVSELRAQIVRPSAPLVD